MSRYLTAFRQKAQVQRFRCLIYRQFLKHPRGVDISSPKSAPGTVARAVNPPPNDGGGQPSMADSGSGNGFNYMYGGENAALRSEGKEPGARRRKLAGYLKAANELRQTYFAAEGRDGIDKSVEGGSDDFTDAQIVGDGNQEIMLFPSYATKHVKSRVRSALAEL